VASNDKFAIIAFRGSEIWKRQEKFDFSKIIADLKADADIRLTDWPGGGKVHRGFKDALGEVWLELAIYTRRLNDQGCKIWVTGHSLGAALAADRCGNVQGVYTFGSPRVGDGAFKKNFDAAAYRIVNNQDIATRVPPPGWYKHVGDIKFIDHEGNIHCRCLIRFTSGIMLLIYQTVNLEDPNPQIFHPCEGLLPVENISEPGRARVYRPVS